MISLPGSLSFVMSAPAKNLWGMPDARPKNHPSIESRLSHKILTPTRIRSAFFLRRTQLLLCFYHLFILLPYLKKSLLIKKFGNFSQNFMNMFIVRDKVEICVVG